MGLSTNRISGKRTPTRRSALLVGLVVMAAGTGDRKRYSCEDSKCAYTFKADPATVRKVCPKCEHARVREL